MIAERIDALAQAIELAEGRLDAEWIAQAESVVGRSRERVTHGTDATVVALAGATGSGKSTLFNALSGSVVSQAGVRRPTTGAVHASVWAEESETVALLDWLEASKRHFVPRSDGDLDGLVLLDLPDFDSTTRENRMLVDRLIQLVDAMVWVTDPQKYADELFHHNYVQPLAGYSEVMVFLLNQIDLLEPAAQDRCISDLTSLLKSDGIPRPEVIGVSATVGTGLEQVRGVMREVVKKRETALLRMDADLRQTATSVDIDLRAKKRLVSKSSRSQLVGSLTSAAGGDHIERAVAKGYRMDAVGATGWPVTRWLRRFRAHPLRRLHLGTEGKTSLPGPSPVEAAEARMSVRRTVDEATQDWGEPWNGLALRAVQENDSTMTDALDKAASRSITDFKRPAWWAIVGAVQWVVFLAMVGGLLWLAVLFGLEYFQVPTEIITPEWEGWPYPTLLAVGGAALGLLIGLLSRLGAMLGARRRARLTRKALFEEVEAVADAYVLRPIESELNIGMELAGLLGVVGSSG
jgi:energy-coupling factor transporter ATP-binding protein EcfA2/uncharacterized integral membrane protein